MRGTVRAGGAGRLTRTLHIAVIAGDGIGPEVIAAATPAIERAASSHGAAITWDALPLGADHYLASGETLPDDLFAHLRDDVDAIFLGALGDPRVPGNEHARDILLGLRQRLDLYINFRPIKLLHPRLSALVPRARTIDVAVFRENTEGFYLGRGTAEHVDTDDEIQVAEEVHTAHKVGRILRAAFEWAVANGRARVTMADKANAVPMHRLWQRQFDQVAREYPDVVSDHRYVDALAMELVQRPETFDVIVTNNLFGDILSDLGAGLVGGLGLAPSANLHPGRPGLFEPVHGSAPGLVGTGTANPMAAVLTGGLMLRSLGLAAAAAALENAVVRAVGAGIVTDDLGGTSSTATVGAWIADHVQPS